MSKRARRDRQTESERQREKQRENEEASNLRDFSLPLIIEF